MEDDRAALMHQAMLELQEMLEDALARAEAGEASPDDWAFIRRECGLPKEATWR